jgi:tRNA(Arg) A34 adenosine deaminase TadA
MRAAISEARASLREGNHGFGAAVVRGGEIVFRSANPCPTLEACLILGLDIRSVRAA